MANNEARYGDSGFRKFPELGESGIKVQHSNDTPTAPSRTSAKGCYTAPSMKPAGNMVYQKSHARPPLKMVGSRPVRQEAEPTGVADGVYQEVMEDLGADEFEPITGEEKFMGQLYLEDEFGENTSNVF
jgi:hypothetical protein